MLVKEIGINASDRHPVVILKEKHGSRVLPIWIGPVEFGSITLAFRKFSSPRPQTHDLLIKLLEDVGAASESEFKKFVESVKASDFANCIKSIQLADDTPIPLPESTSSTSNMLNAESKPTESEQEGE